MTDAAMTDTAAASLHFLGDKPRLKTIKLDWPVEYAGVVYEAIAIARVSAAEVAAFQERVAKATTGSFVWPVFRDLLGEPVPAEVMEGLDDDDRLALDKAALDFLPRRFRGAAASGSDPENGEPIA